ncbi:MAG TPA: histone deacetylase [Saprospiraceae bacterium]|nr:histone deacetylase [Saprospiraceae bacterium]
MSELFITWSDVYKYELPEGHRFPMEKYELIPEQLTYEGTVRNNSFIFPPPLENEWLLLTHTQEYLDKLHQLNLSRREIRDIGFPVKASLISRGKHIANGTLLCAKHALQHQIGLNVAGGTHHAFAGKGEGFCIFNDIAVAANILLYGKEVEKILIVDLDVHQGNGTAHIFSNNPKVFTFSMHGAKNYPLKKEKSDMDIALPDGCNDFQYLDLLFTTLPELIKNQKPDLLFYLSGVDVLGTDRLGRLSLTKEGCKSRDRFILELCYSENIPLAVSMGGGYSQKVSDVVDAHCNTFRLAKDIFYND